MRSNYSHELFRVYNSTYHWLVIIRLPTAVAYQVVEIVILLRKVNLQQWSVLVSANQEMIDFAMKIPNHYKINTQDLQTVDENNATQKQFIRSKGKRIFRESLDGILPQYLLNQPKQDFTVPDDLWFKNQLKDYVHDGFCLKVMRPNKTLHALFGEYVQPHHFQTKAIMRDTILHHLNTSSGIGQSMHFEAITFLQG